MKKLNPLLLGVLFCAFALNSTAQSESFYKETTWSPFEINCNGVTDIIRGTQYCQLIHHYNPKTGVFEWYINKWRAELVSDITEEVFTVNYHLRGITDGDFSNEELGGDAYFIARINARGDKGSDYLVTQILFYDFSANTMNIIRRTMKCL